MFARKFQTSAIFAAIALSAAESQGVAGAEAPAAPKLTAAEKRAKQIDILTKRIADDTEKLAALKTEAETSERLASVGQGSVIVARIGRAETSREVTAEVLGVKTDDTTGAVRYKIAFGEGFDADTQVIQPSQIISVQGADAPVVAEALAQAGVSYEALAAAALSAPNVDDFGRPVDAYGNLL